MRDPLARIAEFSLAADYSCADSGLHGRTGLRSSACPAAERLAGGKRRCALQPEDVRWWRDLKDPQLVNYIEKAISGNQNIKEA